MELKLENITKFYGKQCALDNFNGVFTEGIYGLLGPNGAGKTTLINIIIGVLEASKGAILLDGSDVKKWAQNIWIKLDIYLRNRLFIKISEWMSF